MEPQSEERQGKCLGSSSTKQSSQEINVTKHHIEMLDSQCMLRHTHIIQAANWVNGYKQQVNVQRGEKGCKL